ncbi:MAG TPA: exodeoxyribonuclease VII small subunit [Nitrolancea sp.]|jgi:exodeoxyribonuclease VII small subunit|nr:exodeoxyribonuclease VII small subunit [Nitrolancea sp.]
MNATEETGPNFEDLSRQLEEVLALLERGDLPLEEALKAYESGVILVRQCNDLLDGAELRISELSASVTTAKPSRFIPSEMLFSIDDDEE